MDDILLALLWIAAISGGFAFLALLAEGAEWFCDAMSDWAETISTHYLDD